MLKGVIFLSIFLPELLASTVNFDSSLGDAYIDILGKELSDAGCDLHESVNLSYVGLKEIPENIIRSKFVRSLNLDSNRISSVRETVFDTAPNLECLNLARNEIPLDEIVAFRHRNLRTLILSYQSKERNTESEGKYYDVYDYQTSTIRPKQLNISLGEFPNLESLHLNGIDLGELPSDFIFIFPQLTSLHLKECQITSVSSIFSKLPSTLKSLHLESNSIRRLNLYNIKNLTALYLDNNPSLYLDYSYSNNKLELLSLSNCALQRFDFSSDFSALRSLDLSNNYFNADSLNNLVYLPLLQNLSLASNSLDSFPNLNELSNLGSLSLRDNKIRNIPEIITLSTLKKLDLRGNYIKSVGEMAFSQMSKLKELDLSENMLSWLPPKWARNLTNLVYLNLRSNKFGDIADMALGPLINLRELYVKGNSLTSMNASAFPENCTIYLL